MKEGVRLPTLAGMRAFAASARLGSFEKAAEELCITPSAVSKRVAAVEEILGEPLFTRGANHLEPTRVGREYLLQISALLEQLASVPLHRRGAQLGERLRITAPPTFARQVLAPHIADFHRMHPKIEVEVVISPTVLDSPPTDADVEVRNGKVAGIQLLRDVVAPMMSPELIESLSRPQSPRDLVRYPLLRSPLESWIPWWRAAGLDWAGPSTGPKLADLGLLIEAALTAQGVLLGRPSLTRKWLAAGGLVPLFDITAIPPNQYYVLPWRRSGPADFFTTWLIELCLSIESSAASTFKSFFSR